MSLHKQLPDFEIRSATWEDIPHIVALRNASAQDTQGRDASAAHWQRRLWYESSMDPEVETRLVMAADGTAVGYVEVNGEAPFVIHEVTAVVHPAFRGQGIGTALRQWAEARALQKSDQAPANARVVVHQDPFISNQPACDLLTAAGYVVMRQFVFLRIDMDAQPPPPEWPDGIVVQPLQPADWDKVGPVLGAAFEDHWGIVDYAEDDTAGAETTTAKAESPDNNLEERDPQAFDPDYFNTPGLCFVAWDGDEVVGSCLCNATTVAFPEAGYLGSLSIRRHYRRQGIGLALTRHALTAYYKRGTRTVITDTDGASFTGANHLYEKAGMSIFTRNLVYEKEIRPGTDLVKRSMPNG